MSIKALTVNELIHTLEQIRDKGITNGVGERVLGGDSSIMMVNHHASDDYWITPLQVVDYDCYYPGGPWVVEFRTERDFSLEDTEKLSNWLDGAESE